MKTEKKHSNFWKEFLEATHTTRVKTKKGVSILQNGWIHKSIGEATFCYFRNKPTTRVYKFQNLDLSGLDFSRVGMSDVFFENCNFKGCCFLDSQIHDSWFVGCNFTDAVLTKTSLIDSVFRQCKLQNVALDSSFVKRCSFRGSTLKTALLYGSSFLDMTCHPTTYPDVSSHYQIGKLYPLNYQLLNYQLRKLNPVGMVVDNKTVVIATSRDDIKPILRLNHECELFSLILSSEPINLEDEK